MTKSEFIMKIQGMIEDKNRYINFDYSDTKIVNLEKKKSAWMYSRANLNSVIELLEDSDMTVERLLYSVSSFICNDLHYCVFSDFKLEELDFAFKYSAYDLINVMYMIRHLEL